MSHSNTIRCVICEHEYAASEITKHHLVPKSRGGRATVPLCRACHRQVHATFTEKELERSYGTLEELLAADELHSWIRWIRKRKPRGRIRTRTCRRKQ